MKTLSAPGVKETGEVGLLPAMLHPPVEEVVMKAAASYASSRHLAGEEQVQAGETEQGDGSLKEVYLSIWPGTDPCLVFRFCHSLQQVEGAEMALFTAHAEGFTIKLALRTPVSIMSILGSLPEVEDAIEKEGAGEGPRWGLPKSLEPHRVVTVHISLKAS
ncbi:MAG: hypothetical protein HY531_03595 [Chloroflexi bacterium]|nr:hypothetical protein [Chloroflexota bacterium]